VGGGVCGIRTDDTIECWGRETDVPNGGFSAIDSGAAHACGVRTNGELVCWGGDPPFQPGILHGAFVSVGVSAKIEGMGCGMRVDGTIGCFGTWRDAWTLAPDGAFLELSVGDYHACAIRDDHELACWGSNHQGAVDLPQGEFQAIAAGALHNCAIRRDGSLSCWGMKSGNAFASGNLFYPPPGRFVAVASGGTSDFGPAHSCALREDGSIVCWGDDSLGQTRPPAGAYSFIAAGGATTCAIQRDSLRVRCWGGMHW
jgi:alpha-tubulin suppressor-like RCC1 family protein